jgi:hypothetical protein
MDAITNIPPPEIVIARINACRDELQALKRLLRASQAAARAEEARARRAMTAGSGQGGRHVTV